MTNLQSELRNLPGSAEAYPAQDGPFGVIGLGEGALAAELLQSLVDRRLTREGTQFVLTSTEWEASAEDYMRLAEVSGAKALRFGGGELDKLAGLVERGVTATYHFAQRVAYATGHADEAQEAERLLAGVRDRCVPEVQEGNPARDLAWSLWTRTPLLLAPDQDAFLVWAWQLALARVGKSLSVPVERDALYILTGAFEARHESGDNRVALILGEEDDEMAIAREVLQTRVDEVIFVPYPEGVGGYSGGLATWYFALWVAFYLAERYGVSPEDASPLREVIASLESANDSGARLN
ncbi:SIS domain-containing protein [Deinococcus yavapaiensis]|uniref:Phosphoglucose isomerase-like protein n=1 Tax=Deinococcus yavapaiensis KR-236 TaxID=694435 RepID=A0A318SAU0_9DEIO|nr:SIS domain-containing protein [Deinococcus yavapaiensis]PYE53361.1 phosphoglucose isomerase-like protein [Deinococcus yavapaiensis KR-236]